MTTTHLQQLNFDEVVDHWTTYFTQLLPEDLRRMFVPMLRELATGQPVAPQRLADLSGVPLERALALLRLLPTEWDKSGERVAGAGLTSIPTQHRYETQGNTLWAWCAGDSLGSWQPTRRRCWWVGSWRPGSPGGSARTGCEPSWWSSWLAYH